mmetsp:Transcript_88684/g.192028  ORF Transcript_88684/g.192028 Transcript_88684/m.192028 type:complete len:234 (+) Transcript_88684:78-779(+)
MLVQLPGLPLLRPLHHGADERQVPCMPHGLRGGQLSVRCHGCEAAQGASGGQAEGEEGQGGTEVARGAGARAPRQARGAEQAAEGPSQAEGPLRHARGAEECRACDRADDQHREGRGASEAGIFRAVRQAPARHRDQGPHDAVEICRRRRQHGALQRVPHVREGRRRPRGHPGCRRLRGGRTHPQSELRHDKVLQEVPRRREVRAEGLQFPAQARRRARIRQGRRQGRRQALG